MSGEAPRAVGDSGDRKIASSLQYGLRMTDAATTPGVTIVPANEAGCEDLQAVFGASGGPSRCRCQRFKTRGRQWDSEQASVPVEQRAARLREQTHCGHPEADVATARGVRRGTVAARSPRAAGAAFGWPPPIFARSF